MDISDFLTPDRVILDLRPRGKSALIGDIVRQFARLVPALDPTTVETALRVREQLGSTGLGAGFALPHARIEGLDAYLGLFVRLARPVAFDAIDGQPVRLIFVLLIPSETAEPHVAALAAISRRFREPGLFGRLTNAETPEAAYRALAIH